MLGASQAKGIWASSAVLLDCVRYTVFIYRKGNGHWPKIVLYALRRVFAVNIHGQVGFLQAVLELGQTAYRDDGRLSDAGSWVVTLPSMSTRLYMSWHPREFDAVRASRGCLSGCAHLGRGTICAAFRTFHFGCCFTIRDVYISISVASMDQKSLVGGAIPPYSTRL
jgi:hypothetical protein